MLDTHNQQLSNTPPAPASSPFFGVALRLSLGPSTFGSCETVHRPAAPKGGQWESTTHNESTRPTGNMESESEPEPESSSSRCLFSSLTTSNT